MLLQLMLVLGVGFATSLPQSQDYFYDYPDYPADAQPAPLPPQHAPAVRQQAARRRPVTRPAARAPPTQLDSVTPQQKLANDPNTTPVPIIMDSRRIDTKTGAFVYQYAGADGSAKHEFRFPNGTVIGNYTFINDLGERETRTYSAGVQDGVDETTDPNYVDLSNYDLYRHLERPYVHEAGLDESFASEPQRPLEAQRPSRPRAQAPQRRPAPQQQSVPLDYDDPATFLEPNPLAAAPPPPPRAFAPAPVPVALPPPGQQVRGRVARVRGRARAQVAPQDTDAFLDAVISRFAN